MRSVSHRVTIAASGYFQAGTPSGDWPSTRYLSNIQGHFAYNTYRIGNHLPVGRNGRVDFQAGIISDPLRPADFDLEYLRAGTHEKISRNRQENNKNGCWDDKLLQAKLNRYLL